MLEFFNEGREYKRKVSQIRCRMSKFFVPIKNTDSKHYLQNGKLRFEDLLLNFYPINNLHTSREPSKCL